MVVELVSDLEERKNAIEQEMEEKFAILSSNKIGMHESLLDPEGFPRADINLPAVRSARARIKELENDLRDIMNKLANALNELHSSGSHMSRPLQQRTFSHESPICIVGDVAIGSPASNAGLMINDKVIDVYPHDQEVATRYCKNLSDIQRLISSSENKTLGVKLKRPNDLVETVVLTPKQWNGRGLVGFHLYEIP